MTGGRLLPLEGYYDLRVKGRLAGLVIRLKRFNKVIINWYSNRKTNLPVLTNQFYQIW
jgi:hypothetical protein